MPTGVKAFQNMSNLSISERPTRRTHSSVVVAKAQQIKSFPQHLLENILETSGSIFLALKGVKDDTASLKCSERCST